MRYRETRRLPVEQWTDRTGRHVHIRVNQLVFINMPLFDHAPCLFPPWAVLLYGLTFKTSNRCGKIMERSFLETLDSANRWPLFCTCGKISPVPTALTYIRKSSPGKESSIPSTKGCSLYGVKRIWLFIQHRYWIRSLSSKHPRTTFSSSPPKYIGPQGLPATISSERDTGDQSHGLEGYLVWSVTLSHGGISD